MDGSLYDDLNEFQKPRVRGMYPELKVKRENTLSSLLPDSRAFPLTTSDVDSLFSSGCSMTTTTTASTPNRFLRNSAPVTAEQEMYAQGFLDALDQLHQRQNKNGLLDNSVIHHVGYCGTHTSHASFSPPNPLSLASVAPTYVTASMDTIPDFSNTQGTQSTFNVNTSTSGHDTYAFGGMMPFVQPAQPHPLDTYGGYSVLGANPMGSNGSIHSDDAYGQVNPDLLRELQAVVPADIRTQEHMKVERKKARNRIAASKCRLRRLQRESELSIKVKGLKDHNRDLRDQLNELRGQLADLRNTIDRHIKSGCRIGEHSFNKITA